MIDALQREAQEEIGCEITLASADDTTEVSPDGHPWARPWKGEGPAPAMIWEVSGPGYIPNAKVAVYLGSASGTPQPRDLPALLLLSFDNMIQIGTAVQTVEDAMQDGADLLQRQSIPSDGILTLVGTPSILQRLHEDHPAVAEAIILQAVCGS